MKTLKLQNEQRILKGARKKCQFTHKGKHMRISSDLSAQTLKTKKAWNNIIQALRDHNCQPRTMSSKAILHPNAEMVTT
jgi:EAL domain-containing protein (putative c-di-GMP-specific phosphodiesterase class I)